MAAACQCEGAAARRALSWPFPGLICVLLPETHGACVSRLRPRPGAAGGRGARRLRVIAAGAPAPARAATLGVISGLTVSGSNAEAISAIHVRRRQ